MISAVAIFASDDRWILDNGSGHETEAMRYQEKTKRSEVAGVVRMSLLRTKRGTSRCSARKTGSHMCWSEGGCPYWNVIAAGLALAARGEGPPTTRRLRGRDWIGLGATAAREGKHYRAKAEEAAWQSVSAEHGGSLTAGWRRRRRSLPPPLGPNAQKPSLLSARRMRCPCGKRTFHSRRRPRCRPSDRD
jgi:hypothetical protein